MARSSRDEEFPSASIFDIGQGTIGLEGFSYGCALTAPGTNRCNGDVTGGAIILRARLILVEAYLRLVPGTDWPLPQRTLPSSQRTSTQIARTGQKVRCNRRQVAPHAHVNRNIGRNRRQLLEALCAIS